MSAHLLVEAPRSRAAERRYAYSLLLSERLGLRCEVALSDRQDVCIRLAGDTSAQPARMVVLDGLFAIDDAQWLTEGSLPALPVRFTPVPEWLAPAVPLEPLPLLFGADGAPDAPLVTRAPAEIRVGFDLFGSAFFLLTRYEEVVGTAQRAFDRFPAWASLAARAGFLERPVVDEYVELLWACLSALWPELERRRTAFALRPSHDVDVPLDLGFRTPLQLLRKLGAEAAFGHRGFGSVLGAFTDYARILAGEVERDPAHSFDYIMSASERLGLRSAFYVLVDESERAMGSRYDIRHPVMRKLLRQMHGRGHEIGLHASRRSLGDAQQLARELELLRDVCAQESIEQPDWGVRHHYLRWNSAHSFADLDAAGFAYDTTLTFAERPGFRCGTCREYPAFDLRAGKPLRLRERPLVMMESSVIDERYLGLGYGERALAVIEGLQHACRRVSGEFTFLWHNDRFAKDEQRALYQRVLAAAAQPR